MRLLWASAIIMELVAVPALAQTLAQTQPVPRYGDVNKERSPQEIEADRQTERAYRNSLGNIPDKAPLDPWGQVRSVNTPQATAKNSTHGAPVQRTTTGNAN